MPRRVIASDFNFTHRVDTASPILFLGCCSGEVFKTAVVTMRRASKDQKVYMTYTFKNVIVSNLAPAGRRAVTMCRWRHLSPIRRAHFGNTPRSRATAPKGQGQGRWDFTKAKKV